MAVSKTETVAVSAARVDPRPLPPALAREECLRGFSKSLGVRVCGQANAHAWKKDEAQIGWEVGRRAQDPERQVQVEV